MHILRRRSMFRALALHVVLWAIRVAVDLRRRRLRKIVRVEDDGWPVQHFQSIVLDVLDIIFVLYGRNILLIDIVELEREIRFDELTQNSENTKFTPFVDAFTLAMLCHRSWLMMAALFCTHFFELHIATQTSDIERKYAFVPIMISVPATVHWAPNACFFPRKIDTDRMREDNKNQRQTHFPIRCIWAM